MTTLETKTEAIDSEDLKKIDKNESVFRENISEAILDIEMHVQIS
ncbi:hypothetical protein [Mycoplasma ovis]|nr:hypothetical protein [Mycoplasma ovis]